MLDFDTFATQRLSVIDPVAVGRIENWHALAARYRCELAITWIETLSNQGLWQVSIFATVSPGQVDSFNQLG
jgi:hypothetical protein